MSEKVFQAKVVSLAKKLGYKVYHTYDSRRSEPGFPDLVLVRDKVIFAELKSETGRISRDQEDWIKSLTDAGSFAVVWRPTDWDTIVKILTSRGSGNK